MLFFFNARNISRQQKTLFYTINSTRLKPMLFLVIVVLLLAAFSLVWLGFVPPPNTSTLIRIRDGSLQVSRGNLRPHVKEHVSDILRDAKVTKGFIAITSSNRLMFSRRIPARVHQRLRNVILNP
jgi:hypothetical protein